MLDKITEEIEETVIICVSDKASRPRSTLIKKLSWKVPYM